MNNEVSNKLSIDDASLRDSILRHLRTDSQCLAAKLAAAMSKPLADIKRVIDAMEQRGEIEKLRDPLRITVVQLTELGAKREAELAKHAIGGKSGR